MSEELDPAWAVLQGDGPGSIAISEEEIMDPSGGLGSLGGIWTFLGEVGSCIGSGSLGPGPTVIGQSFSFPAPLVITRVLFVFPTVF